MNKNRIPGCTYFLLHWKSEHLVSRKPPTHPNSRSVRIIGRSLTCPYIMKLYKQCDWYKANMMGYTEGLSC